MGIEDIRDALVVRERSTFLLTDRDGNVPAGNTRGYGVYYADTRHLSAYNLTFNGIRPVMLLSTAEMGYAMEQVMTNPTLHGERDVQHGTVELKRTRVVADVLEETLRLTNYNPYAITLNLLYEFGADFADIFDVRGYVRETQGRTLHPSVTEDSITYGYEGVDGIRRTTVVAFDRAPDYIDDSTAMFRLTLAPRAAETLRIEIALGDKTEGRPATSRLAMVGEEYERWLDGCTKVSSSNELFNRVLDRSLRDIRMLWSETAAGEPFPAAGTPWFDAPFGRDSAIMSMQMLAFRPEIARHCLRLLAKWQGRSVNPARDEEPGKILHEMRFDELSRSGELPYGPYYGSIDSTPLFLMLAAAHDEWTADNALIRLLLPAIRAGLRWMEQWGDAMGDGYLSYAKKSQKGLVNQGWKDSWDAIAHEDGTLARGPIALAEAQAYAYASRIRLAPALERIGETALARKLRDDATALKERFNRDFWSDANGCFALALDGERRRVQSVATNAAHGLWGGLIDPVRARTLIERLMGEDMYSGWGLRTLSSENPRFNPIGYHVGTVWPHDNSIAAMGFKMYGAEDALNRVATGLFEASLSFPYYRLPELFGGDRRSPHGPPVPYPVACRPQSWAAGAFPMLTQAVLGLRPDAAANTLHIVNPVLPPWLDAVRVTNLRIGSGAVTLVYHREGGETLVDVEEASGGVSVVRDDAWLA